MADVVAHEMSSLGRQIEKYAGHIVLKHETSRHGAVWTATDSWPPCTVQGMKGCHSSHCIYIQRVLQHTLPSTQRANPPHAGFTKFIPQ